MVALTTTCIPVLKGVLNLDWKIDPETAIEGFENASSERRVG